MDGTSIGITIDMAIGMAIGIAIGLNFRSEINYIPEKTSWLINGMYSAGSVGIDDEGIFEVLTNDTAVV